MCQEIPFGPTDWDFDLLISVLIFRFFSGCRLSRYEQADELAERGVEMLQPNVNTSFTSANQLIDAAVKHYTDQTHEEASSLEEVMIVHSNWDSVD